MDEVDGHGVDEHPLTTVLSSPRDALAHGHLSVPLMQLARTSVVSAAPDAACSMRIDFLDARCRMFLFAAVQWILHDAFWLAPQWIYFSFSLYVIDSKI